MQDVRVPAANLVYKEGQGFKIAMFCLDQGRYTVAGGSCGLIKACRDACVGYAKERHTFTQPIGEHQLVKQMIANMEAGYEYASHLWMKAGWLKNQGLRSTRASSMAKWIACREAEAPQATPYRCSARTASPTNTRLSGSTGTPRERRSTKAPARSIPSCRPTMPSATDSTRNSSATAGGGAVILQVGRVLTERRSREGKTRLERKEGWESGWTVGSHSTIACARSSRIRRSFFKTLSCCTPDRRWVCLVVLRHTACVFLWRRLGLLFELRVAHLHSVPGSDSPSKLCGKCSKWLGGYIRLVTPGEQ